MAFGIVVFTLVHGRGSARGAHPRQLVFDSGFAPHGDCDWTLSLKASSEAADADAAGRCLHEQRHRSCRKSQRCLTSPAFVARRQRPRTTQFWDMNDALMIDPSARDM